MRSATKYGPLAWPDVIPANLLVVQPICPSFRVWNVDSLILFIEELSVRLKHKKHMYAAGVSMGGYAVWCILSRRPSLFDSVLTFASGGDMVQRIGLRYTLFDLSMLRRTQTRVWSFHGRRDLVIPLSHCVKLVHMTPGAQLTVYARKGHRQTMREAMRYSEMYDWMFEKRPS